MNHSSNREDLLSIGTGAIVFIFSLLVSNLYTGGDQVAYHAAYESIGGLNWSSSRYIYESIISGEEIHYLVILLGSTLDIDKNLLMSIFNGILAAYAIRLFSQWGANLWLASFIVLTNYYFYILYFAAERLKFAFLFLILALLCAKKPIWFYTFSLITLKAHVSILFIYIGGFSAKVYAAVSGEKQERTIAKFVALLVLLVAIFSFLVVDSKYILWKLNTYITYRQPIGATNFVPVGGLLLFSCFYAKRFIEPFIRFLPIFIGIYFIGESRLNMIAYFVFLYYGLRANSGFNLGVLLTTIYFVFKSILFLYSVKIYGNGFP